jgi:hypothetical protein
MSILYDKRRCNWDEFIDPVLFAYRVSASESTGYSPFYLMMGRDPVLPNNAFLPVERKDLPYDLHVSAVAEQLQRAFARAREKQLAAAEANRERCTDKQYKPDFKVGDMLYVWRRAARESRLEADIREAGGRVPAKGRVTIPTKLQNPWQGPYEMKAWEGERHCILNVDGKLERVSVTRLTKQHPWDDGHQDTQCAFRGAPVAVDEPEVPEADEARGSKNYPVKDGELIVFPTEVSEEHPMPFGVGRVVDATNQNDLQFQWYGNADSDPRSTFRPCWIQPSENRHYYKIQPLHPRHKHYLGSLDDVVVKATDLTCHGFNLLNTSERLNPAARRAIVGDAWIRDSWGEERGDLFLCV